MNASTFPARASTPVAAPSVASRRLAPRERGFGVGYGKSSGYAAPTRPYSAPAAARYFRFA
jgi:hypothetical protein